MNILSDTWYLLNKYIRITLRMPMWALFSIIQPLIWLLIFGQLFQKMGTLDGFPSNSYIGFFVPGVLIMTVLFGSSWSGISLLREITFGTVEKMLVTPVSRASIVLSRILHSALTVIVQSLIILVIALVIGSGISSSIDSILESMVIVLLLAIGFSALSNGFAIMLKREEPLVIIGNFMTLPLMFFSSAMIPRSFMPEWIQIVSLFNPIDYAVDASRTALVGEFDLQLYMKGFVVLLIFASGTFAWATYMFIRKKD